MRKLLSVLLISVMTMSLLIGCGAKEEKGSVYYLNFKPEQDKQWKELAEIYTKETGVEVIVETAAAGQYETTLKAAMAKSDAPTLFQVNGPVGLESWKNYCYDLKDSKIAKELTSNDFALMDGDKMAGIAYVIETYGIIYNKELLKKAGYEADDIQSFEDLKEVAKQLRGIGNNLNQLTLLANMGRVEIANLGEAVQELFAISTTLRKLQERGRWKA